MRICKEHTYSRNDEYFVPYSKITGKAALARAISQRARKGNLQVGSGVPFLPSHTLNVFEGEKLGFGVQFDDDETAVDAVVRLVDHLPHPNNTEDDPGEALSQPWLPFGPQFQFTRIDGIDEIVEEIKKELQRYAVKELKDDDDETDVLEPFLARTDWRFQICVLPQKGKKMYRSPTGHKEQWNNLMEFLSKEKIASGGVFPRALYMEAHIVPRKKKPTRK